MFSSALTRRVEELLGLLAERADHDESLEVPARLGELADRQQRSDQRQRRQHRVDAAAVGQARVDHRRGLVDPPADLGDDLVDDPPQVVLVVEAHRRLVQLAGALDPDVVGAVDHDLGDGVVLEQRLDRPVAERVVGDLLHQPVAVGDREPALLAEPVTDVGQHHRLQLGVVHALVVEPRTEVGDDRQVDPVLQLGERIRPLLDGLGTVAVETFAKFHHALPRRISGRPRRPPDGGLARNCDEHTGERVERARRVRALL